MLSYYEQLRRRHGLPVLPIALYLRVGLDGIGWDVYEEKYWDHRLLSFTYAYVGLPGLDGEQYVAGEHLLGVALTALMRVPPARRAAVHAEALRRLAVARENDYRRYLLLDCLEAYATLDEAQAQELGELLRTERYQGAQAMAVTTFEKGVQAGLQQGLQQGQRTTIRTLLESRFGPLSPSAEERLDSLSPERLEALTLALLKAQSLQELGLED
jgi:3-methyladenine DNA glycosylase/8-oxoguanine DNA glycosylase